MTKLVWTRDEILADHAYAKPHVEAGYRLHGGFDADGKYISPRTLNRWPAIRAWAEALKARGHEARRASQQLMTRGLVSERRAAELPARARLRPDAVGFAERHRRDRGARARCSRKPRRRTSSPLSTRTSPQTAIGHLNKGLLRAHGLDEGGDGARRGGHDAMWFAVRDMLFGKHAYPHAEVPESLARPETGRLMPQIPTEHEDWILLLMNVLMIEVRAEKFFNFCTTVMRDPGEFPRPPRGGAACRRSRRPHPPGRGIACRLSRRRHLRTAQLHVQDGGGQHGGPRLHRSGLARHDAVARGDQRRFRSRSARARNSRTLFGTRPDGVALQRSFDGLEQKEAA